MAIKLIPEVLDRTARGRTPTVSPAAWNERVAALWYVGWCGCGSRAFGRRIDRGEVSAEVSCPRCDLSASATARWVRVPAAA